MRRHGQGVRIILYQVKRVLEHDGNHGGSWNTVSWNKISWPTIYHDIWWNIMIYQGVKCISSAIGGSGVHFCGLRCGFSHWGTLLPGGSCPWWLHSGFTKKSYLVAATVHFLLVTRSGQKYMTMLLPSHLALSRPARTHRTNIWTTVALIEACLILLDRSSCFLPLLFLPKVLQSDHIWSYLGSMSI